MGARMYAMIPNVFVDSPDDVRAQINPDCAELEIVFTADEGADYYFMIRQVRGVVMARALGEALIRLAEREEALAPDDRDGVAVPGESDPIPPPMAVRMDDCSECGGKYNGPCECKRRSSVAPLEYAEMNCNHCLGGGLEIVDGDAVACRACGGRGSKSNGRER